ncbi:AgmX/PglI C-terminal domain-containing protein [Myxococcus stipitatus]|uniref:AgmX/PglI C-terminal domain-containing protein n=1 Tax=Myxococcus stipitatus TaxID=83455 RepID=UPI0030CE0872
MNFTCDNCQKRYSIADEKVRGKTVKVRCKNCQNVITVEGPAEEESTRVVSLADVERLRAQERSLAEPAAAAPAPVASSPALDKAPPAALQTPWDDEPTRAAPLRATGSPWFVMVRNKQEGPLDEGALRELIATGTISGRSFFWQQGMADWKRGADVPELAGLFAPPPAPEPPPPPPPPVAEPPPARAAKSAPARREPEPPPSYAEPEQRFEPEPEPQPPPEEEPEAAAQRKWVPEEDPDTTYFGEPDPRNQPQPASRRGGAPAASAAPLNELFSDLDLPEKGEQDEGVPHEDPLAAARGDEDEEPPARESSARNAAKAKGGKSKKASPKSGGGGSKGKVVALLLVLLIVIPLGAAFALDVTGIMPLRVKTLDPAGNVVERSVFSGAGMTALIDQMTGKPAPVPAAKPPSAPAADEQPSAPTPPVAGEGGAAVVPSEEKAAPAAGGDSEKSANAEKQAAAPQAGEGAEAAAGEDEVGGPSDEEVERVVNEKQTAFRDCVAQELRRNPSFKGGNVTLTATVGTSGAVKSTTFSRKDLNAASNAVGNCIREQAKGMVFSSFKGEDVDLEIPIALSAR